MLSTTKTQVPLVFPIFYSMEIDCKRGEENFFKLQILAWLMNEKQFCDGFLNFIEMLGAAMFQVECSFEMPPMPLIISLK